MFIFTSLLFGSVLLNRDMLLTGFMSVFILCMSSDPQSSRARKLCVTMEPALLLKGDIMVREKSFLGTFYP